MRSTVRIDDQIFAEIRQRAAKERVSLTQMLNRLLRRGLKAARERSPRQPYREEIFSLGRPRADLRKALAVAAELEDEEIVRKLELRK
jgi:hypothetical protein